MAIDSAEKRRSISGINIPLMPGVTPNASPDQEWRQEVAWLYSGIAVSTLVYSSYGLPFLYTAANWAQISFYLETYLRATTGTVYFRLYNETDGVDVASSNMSTTSATFTLLRTAALSMIDCKVYRLQFGKSGSDAGETYGGQLIGVDNV